MIDVHDFFAKTIIHDDMDNLNNSFDHSEANNTSTLSLNNYQSHYSIGDHGYDDNGRRDYDIWSGGYGPLFEMACNKRSRVVLKEIREPSHSSDSNDEGVETMPYFSLSSSTNLTSTTEEEDYDHVTKKLHGKSRRNYESEIHDLHENCWPLLDDGFPSRAKLFTEEYYPPTLMNCYLQEINAGINQLARWTVRMKEFTSTDPVEFKAALENLRGQTGQNPLRAWTVKINTVIELIRDIQYDVETEISGQDEALAF